VATEAPGDLDELRDVIEAYMDRLPDADGHCMVHARFKADELLYWLRAHEHAARRRRVDASIDASAS